MGKMAIAFANIIVIQYLITSRYQVQHKWAWLVLTALVLDGILGVHAGQRNK